MPTHMAIHFCLCSTLVFLNIFVYALACTCPHTCVCACLSMSAHMSPAHAYPHFPCPRLPTCPLHMSMAATDRRFRSDFFFYFFFGGEGRYAFFTENAADRSLAERGSFFFIQRSRRMPTVSGEGPRRDPSGVHIAKPSR